MFENLVLLPSQLPKISGPSPTQRLCWAMLEDVLLLRKEHAPLKDAAQRRRLQRQREQDEA